MVKITGYWVSIQLLFRWNQIVENSEDVAKLGFNTTIVSVEHKFLSIQLLGVVSFNTTIVSVEPDCGE